MCWGALGRSGVGEKGLGLPYYLPTYSSQYVFLPGSCLQPHIRKSTLLCHFILSPLLFPPLPFTPLGIWFDVIRRGYCIKARANKAVEAFRVSYVYFFRDKGGVMKSSFLRFRISSPFLSSSCIYCCFLLFSFVLKMALFLTKQFLPFHPGRLLDAIILSIPWGKRIWLNRKSTFLNKSQFLT